jgi:hypothetical protein
MRWLLNIAALLLSFSSLAFPQDRLQVVSSIPLPKSIRTRLGSGLRLGCPRDGGTLAALSPKVVAKHVEWTHEIVALTPGGTVKARFDLDKVLGTGMANIEDFAPGRDGEIYVVASRILEHFERDQSGRIIERSRVRDQTLWLVRFNDTGQFLAKTQIEVDYFAYIRIAVLPSGSFLVVGYLSHPTPPGVLAEEKLEPFSGIFSRDVGFVRRVELPDTVLLRDPRINGNVLQTTPMLADDGDIYVVMVGEKPALAVVRPDGTVPRTVELHIPSGYRLSEAQLAGARLISHLNETNHTGPFIDHDQFAELDAQSGDVLFLHSLPGIALRPGCQTQSGITALDPAGTLDTLMAPAGDDAEVPGPNKVP